MTRKTVPIAIVGLFVVSLGALRVLSVGPHRANAETQKLIQGQDIKQDQVSPEVRFVAAGIANARERFRCAQVVMTRYEWTSKQYLDARVPKGTTTKSPMDQYPDDGREQTDKVHWYYQAPRMAFDIAYQSNATTPHLLRSERITIDSKSDMFLQQYDSSKIQAKGGIYYYGTIKLHGEAIRNTLVQNYERMDPRSYAYFVGSIPLDRLFLRNTDIAGFDGMLPPVYKGEEVIKGSRCMVIEVSPEEDRWVFWIDVDHGYVLRRMELYTRRGDKMIMQSETQVQELTESNGMWLPALLETKQYRAPAENQAQAQPFSLTRITLSDFQADCKIPADNFSFKWPIGTRVTDTTEPAHPVDFIVVVVEQEELPMLNKLREEQNLQPLKVTAVEEKDLTNLNASREEQGLKPLRQPVIVMLEQQYLPALLNSRKKSEPRTGQDSKDLTVKELR